MGVLLCSGGTLSAVIVNVNICVQRTVVVNGAQSLIYQSNNNKGVVDGIWK